MKTAAAIRRASQQARNAMYELDRATSAELRTDYQRAADAVRAAIELSADELAAGQRPADIPLPDADVNDSSLRGVLT